MQTEQVTYTRISASADTTTETPGPEATDWATLLTTPAAAQPAALEARVAAIEATLKA